MGRALPIASAVSCLLFVAAGCGGDDDSSSDAGAAGSSSGGKSGGGGKSGAAGGGGKSGSGGRAAAGSGGSSDADQSVTIRFKAKLGDADLHCGDEYAGMGSRKQRATPQDFRFFVQEVRLVTRDGKENPVTFDERAPFQQAGVALIDFSNGDGACQSGGTEINTEITAKVAAGEYDGIVFANGVPETLNHQNISVAEPPLQDATTYWGWQSGYRFLLAELLPTDVQPPADDAGPGGVASFVHVGTTGCTGTPTGGFTCTRPNRTQIKLEGFDPEKNTVVADLAKVFEDVDLSQTVECHGAGPSCAPMYAALGLDLDSGQPKGEQKVFRVE